MERDVTDGVLKCCGGMRQSPKSNAKARPDRFGRVAGAAACLAVLFERYLVAADMEMKPAELLADDTPAFVHAGSSLKWVTALPREGHADACARHGLDPTRSEVFLSDQVLVFYVQGLVSFWPAFSPPHGYSRPCSRELLKKESLPVDEISGAVSPFTAAQEWDAHFRHDGDDNSQLH